MNTLTLLKNAANSYVIANRPPGAPMSDEQRKAMFASMRGGGGGGGRGRSGGGGGSSDQPYDPAQKFRDIEQKLMGEGDPLYESDLDRARREAQVGLGSGITPVDPLIDTASEVATDAINESSMPSWLKTGLIAGAAFLGGAGVRSLFKRAAKSSKSAAKKAGKSAAKKAGKSGAKKSSKKSRTTSSDIPPSSSGDSKSTAPKSRASSSGASSASSGSSSDVPSSAKAPNRINHGSTYEKHRDSVFGKDWSSYSDKDIISDIRSREARINKAEASGYKGFADSLRAENDHLRSVIKQRSNAGASAPESKAAPSFRSSPKSGDAPNSPKQQVRDLQSDSKPPSDYAAEPPDKYGVTKYADPNRWKDMSYEGGGTFYYSHPSMPGQYFDSQKNLWKAHKIRKQAKADGTWDISNSSSKTVVYIPNSIKANLFRKAAGDKKKRLKNRIQSLLFMT